ncbi:MAG: 4-(cytidine 5'-diphospho)-2-C-methyl-D-erythritol kinase [Alphaproteobacteria bacterium]|nr:4-(cytidine 5'-diphospho)-2-C-methyl-D-erythritol kinase [Alphaproteobacteria bacterium]
MTAGRSLSVFAPAKINLFLHVGDRRADGYHDISSLAAFADVGDTVSATLTEELSLTNVGPFARALDDDCGDNLVMRAAIVLQDWARAAGRRVDGARLTLQKNLPVASGIGGGSSDAAATLKLLNDLWHLHADDLTSIGKSLGADVPVCLAAAASFMQGVGERLAPCPIPSLPAVLVNPRVSLMTAEVFQELKARSGAGSSSPPNFDSLENVVAWLAQLKNDLEEPAGRIAPVVLDTLSELAATPNCLLSRMSGSGATCFGLYATKAEAAGAARTLQERRAHWWIAATELR